MGGSSITWAEMKQQQQSAPSHPDNRSNKAKSCQQFVIPSLAKQGKWCARRKDKLEEGSRELFLKDALLEPRSPGFHFCLLMF